jgi:tRNA G18 (ribose-2'-O)-methylase SpoU
MRVISSPQNPAFKGLKQLLAPRGIKKAQRALISGEKVVREALRLCPESCVAWITSPKHDVPPPASVPRLSHYRLSPDLFRALDSFGTRFPLLVVSPPPLETWDPGQGLSRGFSLLVPFQDPENVGSVIRSAVAFGVDRIILLRESAHPFHPKSLRASAGAVLRARLAAGPGLDELPAELPLVPLSQQGTDLLAFRFPPTCGLLPGLEGRGLPPRWRENAVSIPMGRSVESLNAAAAVAIALHQWSRTRPRTRAPGSGNAARPGPLGGSRWKREPGSS